MIKATTDTVGSMPMPTLITVLSKGGSSGDVQQRAVGDDDEVQAKNALAACLSANCTDVCHQREGACNLGTRIFVLCAIASQEHRRLAADTGHAGTDMSSFFCS